MGMLTIEISRHDIHAGDLPQKRTITVEESILLSDFCQQHLTGFLPKVGLWIISVSGEDVAYVDGNEVGVEDDPSMGELVKADASWVACRLV